jgi:hypothetical protein
VDAVRIEARECNFGRLVALELETHLPVLVPHDQLAALRLCRERQHQRCEHTGHFLGVAVADEEAALVIDEELVEGSRDRVGHAKPLDRPRDDDLRASAPNVCHQ